MIPLSKEQILTLKCLKEVNVFGIGNKKILLIANTIIDMNLSITTYEELAVLMSNMKEKAIRSVTLPDLNNAYQLAKKIIEASVHAQIGLVGYFDDDYPKKLQHTVNEEGKLDPPLLLWYRGDLSIAKFPGLAVIGTREATPEGIAGGEYLSAEFAKRGFNIVSGLALGCDTSGHNGALKVGGKTTAILANGLDHNSIYPIENQELAERIVQSGGLLLSEYWIGTTVNRYNLVARDRLQAGLANATLVIQTGINGGAMHAAMCTLKTGKPLYAMFFQNSTTNQHEKCLGNALLVSKGAKAIKGNDNIDRIVDSIINTDVHQGTLF